MLRDLKSDKITNIQFPKHGALKPHARLSREQVLEIFRVRVAAPSAVRIAACYGISEKAIRDIWTARTWSRETSHLDPTRTVELKHIGRPKGCIDSKPRKRRGGAKQNMLPQGESHTQSGTSKTRPTPPSGCFTEQAPTETVSCSVQTSPSDIKVCFHDDATISSSSGEIAVGSAQRTSTAASVDDLLYDWSEEFWSRSPYHDPFFSV